MLLDLIAAAKATPEPAPVEIEEMPPSAEAGGLAAIAEDIGLEVVSTVESGGLVSLSTKIEGYTCDITLTTPAGGAGAIVTKVHTHTLPGIAYATEGVAAKIAEMLAPYVMQYPIVEPVTVEPDPVAVEPDPIKTPALLPIGEEINPLPSDEETKTVPPPAKPPKGSGFGEKKGAPAPEGEDKV